MILKKILFIMLLGFVSPSLLFATDDQGGETNKVDSQGRKQGKWIYLGKDRPESGFPVDGKIERRKTALATAAPALIAFLMFKG